jgi:hypothetical protein
MDLPTLTRFFQWCTILNGGLLIFWSLCLMAMPDFVYRLQTKFFPMSRDTWNTVMYCFLGFMKIVVIVFCVAPWVALLIIAE